MTNLEHRQQQTGWGRLLLTLVLGILLTTAVLAFPAGTALAQEPATAETTTRLNLREGPGLEYDVIQVLDPETEVTFTGLRDFSGDWVQVEIEDGTEGWVAVQFLSAAPDPETLEIWTPDDGDGDGDDDDAEEPAEEEEEGGFSSAVVTATTTVNLNLRAEPSLDAEILEVLPAGTVVGFTGFTDGTGEWVQVDTLISPVGWVFGSFLSSVPDDLEVRPADLPPEEEQDDEEEEEEATEPPFPSSVVTATTTVNLNLREGPGLDFPRITTLPAGTVVGFTGFMDETGDWVQVESEDGDVGWVAAQFLSNVPDGLEVWTGDDGDDGNGDDGE